MSAISIAQNVGVGFLIGNPSYKLHVFTSVANDRGVNALHTGATGTNYGLYSKLTGAATTNIAGYFTATGATNNYGLIVPSGGGSVGIGTSTPDASALMDIESTTQGVLVPRMTADERDAIASPAAGLVVYAQDEEQGFFYYNGSIWSPISTPVTRVKDPTTSKTSNTTLTDDADLGISVAANEVWRLQGMLSVTGPAAAGLKLAFVESSTIELSVRVYKYDDAGNKTLVGLITEAYNTGGLVVPIIGGGAENHIFFEGIAVAGASAGDVSVQWAQNVSDASATSVIEDHSYMECTKLK